MNTTISDARTRGQAACVAIVGPRQLGREALRCLIASPTLFVVGDGETFTDATMQIAPGTKLDLIMYCLSSDAEVEQQLPRIEKVRAQFTSIKIVVLADCTQAATKLKTIRLGVEAFLTNDISVAVLQRALELVLLGQHLFPAGLARLLSDPPRGSAEVKANVPQIPPEALSNRVRQEVAALSAREQQILDCLVNGLTNKVIARELSITEATVKVHVKALLRKTRMANRTQAAIWALNHSVESETSHGTTRVRYAATAPWCGESLDRAHLPATLAANDTIEGSVSEPDDTGRRLEADDDFALLGGEGVATKLWADDCLGVEGQTVRTV